MYRPLLALTTVALVVTSAARGLPAGEILHELRAFAQTGRVLYIAAHPDDENTRLITYFARGRGYRTGYLSLTRGDGGQNLIGAELGSELGLIRTHELLAARAIDSGVQYFSRARDFGFSKDAEETLRIWDREEVLADMVRVIREFRPDLLITRFSPEPGGTHGHHTASAQLALDAFERAADPSYRRDELAGWPPWQTRRVFWNAWAGRGTSFSGNPLSLDIGGFDPLLGESFGETAARSRTMHKSQGFGATGSRGISIDYFRLLAGDPAETDLFEGIDTTWGRLSGGSAIGPRVQAIIDRFQPLDPAQSVPALLDLRQRVAALPASVDRDEKQSHLDRIIVACLGLHTLTTLPQAEVVPGETLTLRHTLIVRSQAVPVTWRATRLLGFEAAVEAAIPLEFNRPAQNETNLVLPADHPLTQPYWLRQDGTPGLFAVADPALIGHPLAPPPIVVAHEVEVGGQRLTLLDSPVQVTNDPVRGEQRHPLRVIPPVSLQFAQPLELFAPGSSRDISVDVTAHRAGAAGTLRLTVPDGWTVQPRQHSFRLADAGGARRFNFTVTAPAAADRASLGAEVVVDGRTYGHSRREIRYEHIPTLVLQPPAALRVVSLELATRGQRIGYLAGAGDLVPEALQRMGYQVVPLTVDELSPQRLERLDAVVLGIRAMNTRIGLEHRLSALFDYAAAGGAVILQYNTSQGLRASTFSPYPLRLSRDRVTEEDSEVTFLRPEHPVLRSPNRIDRADFDGWVQERGLYFADQWAAPFEPILAMADVGEPPRQGSLVVARHGRGWFVYTGLSFFRQLPEGVPGAYRLFANLVSLPAADAQD